MLTAKLGVNVGKYAICGEHMSHMGMGGPYAFTYLYISLHLNLELGKNDTNGGFPMARLAEIMFQFLAAKSHTCQRRTNSGT